MWVVGSHLSITLCDAVEHLPRTTHDIDAYVVTCNNTRYFVMYYDVYMTEQEAELHVSMAILLRNLNSGVLCIS